MDEKEFRPFAKQLEADFGQGVDWRRNPIQFRDPLIKEAEWLAYLDSYDPFLAGSTSRTVSDVSGLPRWSDAATWSGSIPGPNTIVVIKAGQQVVLDQSATVKGILIVGAGSALIIVDDPGKAIQLTSDYVLALDGALFQAGTEANHLETEFILELSGDDPALVLPVSDIVDGNTVESVAVAQ